MNIARYNIKPFGTDDHWVAEADDKGPFCFASDVETEIARLKGEGSSSIVGKAYHDGIVKELKAQLKDQAMEEIEAQLTEEVSELKAQLKDQAAEYDRRLKSETEAKRYCADKSVQRREKLTKAETALFGAGFTYNEHSEIPWKPPVNAAARNLHRQVAELERHIATQDKEIEDLKADVKCLEESMLDVNAELNASLVERDGAQDKLDDDADLVLKLKDRLRRTAQTLAEHKVCDQTMEAVIERLIFNADRKKETIKELQALLRTAGNAGDGCKSWMELLRELREANKSIEELKAQLNLAMEHGLVLERYGRHFHGASQVVEAQEFFK